MKKILLPIAVGIALLASCGENAQEETLNTDIIDNPISAESSAEDEGKRPFFEFVEEIKEFGTITQGETVSMTFRFRNVGQSNLIISSAQGSCGCTVPEWPKEPIKPGEEGKINIIFNSTGKQGLQNKTITLIANTIPNTKVIAIKGEVLVPNTNQ
ncbi:MAG: DUF1573 domain-containing protein [Flavobacteriales bacterium]|nr:DUF1573 domain-containing protein [Flavobacteriales bacterium]